MDEDIFEGLVAVVQYRRFDQTENFDPWHTMAAFDQPGPAERYRDQCADGNTVWEYRVVEVDRSRVS